MDAVASSIPRQQWPPVLPGFTHISRYWDASHQLTRATVRPGEYYVTRNEEIITTVLGSCVSACIRDVRSGIGGMNHFMLPGDSAGKTSVGGENMGLATRYGIAAMETMINEVLKQGVTKRHMELKLFGGGRVLAMEVNNIGHRNIAFVRSFVQTESLNVVAEDLGGEHPRKIYFFPRSGKVLVRKLRSLQNMAIVDQEKNYKQSIVDRQKPGEIELFD